MAPPLGELFLEMEIIVKLCWCPFSLSLTSPDPQGELTPQLLAIQVEAGGRVPYILSRMGWVLLSLTPHLQAISPGCIQNITLSLRPFRIQWRVQSLLTDARTSCDDPRAARTSYQC